MATKLDQAGLVRVERQRQLLKPHTHCIEEATGVVLMLEAGHQIIGIAHDNHVAGSLVPSPALGPQVEDVVQVDVGNPADPELDGAGHTNGHADDGAAAEIDITSTDLPAF